MNASSICARWKGEAWECAPGDALLDPFYFNPATHTTPILTVLSFHASYPQGRRFERAAAGERWVRVG